MKILRFLNWFTKSFDAGIGESLIAAAAAAGTAAASSAAADKRQKRQEDLNAQLAQFESDKSSQGRKAIERYLETVTPEARAQSQATTQEDITQGLQRGAEGVQGFAVPEKVAGNLSTDYGRVRGQTQEAAAERLRKAIGNLSVIGTPAQSELNRSIDYGRALADVGNAAQAGQSVATRFNQAMGLAQPDRNLAFAGQVVSGLSPTLQKLVKPTPPPGTAPTSADSSNYFANV